MTSNAKKKQFVKKLFQYSLDKLRSDELENELRLLLKEDSPYLKLYKYRGFDIDGYSIKNLETQTLHCSKRSKFNDPFDCRVGIDFDSFVSAFIDVDTDRISQLFKKFFLIVTKRIKSTNLSEEEKTIIRRWQQSSELVKFCLKCDSKKNISINFFRNYFSNNPELIYELVNGAIADGGYKKAFQNKKEEFNQRISQLFSNANITYHYKSVYELEAERKGISVDSDQIELVSKIYQEENPEVAQKIREMFKSIDVQMADLFDNLLFVGSLCTDYSNPLMWAHYADGHKGFCIEFDYSNENEETLLPFPVLYSKDIVKMPWKYCLTSNGVESPEFTASIMQATLTKDEVWKYENEWRILLPNNFEQDHKMPKISCVYLGALCSSENEDKILEIAKKNEFVVKRMTVDRGKFKFHTKTVYKPEQI